ncbi:uncharacterized protein LOC132797711 [Drosophila nasuta]|uniref:uncharacterized protein LOC132797711 n=1 Tax=Drosophila nasuta TaxID=42062 RepID=UPI00295F4701|nr:uncharacterized protein LOC132797711 [Drosophila nasuta]
MDDKSHGQLNFHLTQVISGHGCFRSYLFRFGHDTAEECPACFPTAVEDAEHVIFQCGRYATLRQELADAIGERLTVSTLVPLMLVSSTNWTLISQFVAAVMNEQRRAEKARQRTRDYLSDRKLWYTTSTGTESYEVTGGVPRDQCSAPPCGTLCTTESSA